MPYRDMICHLDTVLLILIVLYIVTVFFIKKLSFSQEYIYGRVAAYWQPKEKSHTIITIASEDVNG